MAEARLDLFEVGQRSSGPGHAATGDIGDIRATALRVVGAIRRPALYSWAAGRVAIGNRFAVGTPRRLRVDLLVGAGSRWWAKEVEDRDRGCDVARSSVPTIVAYLGLRRRSPKPTLAIISVELSLNGRYTTGRLLDERPPAHRWRGPAVFAPRVLVDVSTARSIASAALTLVHWPHHSDRRVRSAIARDTEMPSAIALVLRRRVTADSSCEREMQHRALAASMLSHARLRVGSTC
jgi:hypothetical protein